MIKQILISSAIIAVISLLSILFEKTAFPGLKYSLWLIVAVNLLLPANLPFAMHETGQTVTAVQAVQPETDDPVLTNRIKWENRFNIIRLIGIIVCTAAFLRSNLRFAKQLRKSRVPVARFRDKLPVYRTQEIPSPCLFGVFRPAIYLWENKTLSEEQEEYIMTHEYTHYRHGDHLWSLVRFLCVILHWYNPLVWLAARLCAKDGEFACDRGTLNIIGQDKCLEYTKALIAVASESNKSNTYLLVSGCCAGSIRNPSELTKRSRQIIE